MRLPESFMEKVTVAPSGCWEWTGSKYGNGYGRYRPDGEPCARDGKDSRVLAHRFAYEAAHGPIENVINHLCENKGCVNPEHLEDVTQLENVHYSLTDTCVRGHDIAHGSPNVWVDKKRNKRKCRECMRLHAALVYERHKDRVLERRRQYYQENREAHLAQKREYYIRNRDKIRARQQARREKESS